MAAKILLEAMSARPDSIKVSKNAKGEFSFEVKLYYDRLGKERPPVASIKAMYNQLEKEFRAPRKKLQQKK